MLKIGRFFAGVVLVLLVAGAGIKFFPVSEQILLSDAPLWLKRVIELLIPPEDLFEPIKMKRTTFKQLARGIILKFQHKYEGPYHVFIIYLPKGHIPREEWSGSLYCFGGHSLLKESPILINSPITTKYGSGLIVDFYSVPKELPSDVAIKCRLTIKSDYSADSLPDEVVRVVVSRLSRAI